MSNTRSVLKLIKDGEDDEAAPLSPNGDSGDESKKRKKPMGHSKVATRHGKTVWRNDWLYRPLSRFTSRPFQQTLGIHFLIVMIASFFIATGSMLLGAMYGPLSALTRPTIGLAAMQLGLFHYFAYAMLYHIRVAAFYMPHINPLMTAAEMANFQLGLVPAIVQMLAQAVGHVAAGGLVLGIIKSGNPGPSILNNSGIAASLVTNTVSSGWAFFLQIVCSTFFTWFYFHNYNYRVREEVFQEQGDIYGPNADSRYLAQNLGYIKALTIAMSYPIYGLTTGNPFHWLTGCTVVGQCGVSGIWGVPLGPVVGTLCGYVLHKATWPLTGTFGKNKYE